MNRESIMSTFNDESPSADDVHEAIIATIAAFNAFNGGLHSDSYSPSAGRTTVLTFEFHERARFVGTGRGFTAAAQDLCERIWGCIEREEAAE